MIGELEFSFDIICLLMLLYAPLQVRHYDTCNERPRNATDCVHQHSPSDVASNMTTISTFKKPKCKTVYMITFLRSHPANTTTLGQRCV